MNNNLECIDINWGVLGAKLAALSNVEQTAFLKSFAQEMNKYETTHQRDMQLCYIQTGCDDRGQKLTDKEREVFEFLGTKDE